MRRALVLLGLCSCDALFGLDSLSYSPDAMSDGAPDAPQMTVKGNVLQRWLHNDAANMPVLEPFAPTALPVTVRLADGSVPQTSWDPTTGEFTFVAGLGERYTVTHATDSGTYEYQMTTPTLTIQDVIPGHPGQLPPGAGAAVQWTPPTVSLVASDLRFVTTGVWTTTVPTMPVANTFTVSWPAAGSLGGQRAALLSAARNDSLYFLHYASIASSPPHRIVDQYAPVVNTSFNANTTTSYSTALQTLPRAHCVDIHFRRTTEHARLMQYPKFGSPTASTQLFAVAMPELGFRVPYELAVFTGNADGNLAINYTNPFPGFGTMILQNNVVVRQITGGATISANTQYFDVITPTTTCSRHDDPPLPAFAVTPKVAGIPLDDDVVIGVDATKRVELSWSWDGEPAQVTQVNLHKGTQFMRAYFTTDNKVLIDPAHLDANTSYRFTLAPVLGYYAKIADGDFVTRIYPARISILMTGYFKVVKSN